MSDLPLMCPWCGRKFSRENCILNPFGSGLMPPHDHGLAQDRRECPGSNQAPRNAEAGRRPLWKDVGVP